MQSPRLCFERLRRWLQGFGFKHLRPCEYGFERKPKKFRVIILIYVDDLIILGSSLSIVSCVKEKFGSLFKIKDLDELRYFLGVSFENIENVAFCMKLLTVNVFWSDVGWVWQSRLQCRWLKTYKACFWMVPSMRLASQF